MIIPILLFLFAMNSAYAFFTASAGESTSSLATAILRLEMDSISSDYYEVRDNSSANKTWVSLEPSTDVVVPGYKFKIKGTVNNTETTEMYALIRLQVFLGDSLEETSYYTLNEANGNYKFSAEITETDASAKLPGETNAGFELEYQLPFDKDEDDLSEKPIKFVVTAGGIQTAHLAGTEAESATKATNKIIGILD